MGGGVSLPVSGLYSSFAKVKEELVPFRAKGNLSPTGRAGEAGKGLPRSDIHSSLGGSEGDCLCPQWELGRVPAESRALN